jgi:hypothetical protein
MFYLIQRVFPGCFFLNPTCFSWLFFFKPVIYYIQNAADQIIFFKYKNYLIIANIFIVKKNLNCVEIIFI